MLENLRKKYQSESEIAQCLWIYWSSL